MDTKVFETLLHRDPAAHKFMFGHVLVIGGSPGMVGAPLLVAQAALRTGAGVVTIGSTATVIPQLEKRVVELMTLILPATRSSLEKTVNEFIHARKCSVIVIGPGLPSDEYTQELLRVILLHQTIPVIIDAGALLAFHTFMSEHPDFRRDAVVLTPHPGEFHRLLAPSEQLTEDTKQQVLQAYAQHVHAIVALKGHPTLVADSNGTVYSNTTGNPGLATAGTGDVLSGIIAGMIAQHIDIYSAVKAAVYLHGLAGDIAAKDKTEPGMIASDVIDAIPRALRSIAHE